MIPRVLHFVWVGDESRIPATCIQTWRDLNPGYEVKVWGNRELKERAWRNRPLIDVLAGRAMWSGVADLMRYEILADDGGITLDADGVCLRPLEDWLLEPNEFAVWENEVLRPGLVANGYLGSVAGSAFFGGVVADLGGLRWSEDLLPWQATGPLFLTKYIRRSRSMLTIYPSHYFLPNHYSGLRYAGGGQVFADQQWATTADHASGKPVDTRALEPWPSIDGPKQPWHRTLRLAARGLRRRVRRRLGSN